MTVFGRHAARLLVLVAVGLALLVPLSARAAQNDVAVDEAHVDGAAAEEGHAEPDPLALSANLSIWSALVFLLFLFVLTKLAWKPLTAGLDARERRIRDDIASAENARLKAEQLLAEHASRLDQVQDEVKAILAEARRDAEVARQNIVASAQSEAEATKTRAITEIERARDQALKELFDSMAGRVADATEHVLGRGLDAGDQQRLIDEALAGFSERSVTATRA